MLAVLHREAAASGRERDIDQGSLAFTDNARVSNYTKPERPPGVPPQFYIGAEYVNGTGRTLLWTCDQDCERAGGSTACCTGNLNCNVHYMDWQEMSALGMWLIEQADIARDRQLQEQHPV
jgi:hypothetical protein